MAKHDENKDVRLVGKRCKISLYDKSIEAPKGTIIGIKLWGRIDYLCHYCGYRFHWTSGPVRPITSTSDDNDKTRRDYKKAAKEQTLTDKTKRKR